MIDDRCLDLNSEKFSAADSDRVALASMAFQWDPHQLEACIGVSSALRPIIRPIIERRLKDELIDRLLMEAEPHTTELIRELTVNRLIPPFVHEECLGVRWEDIRERAEVTMVGSPLTHERFLRRHRGTYGPELRAGERGFPSAYSKVDGLLLCGDSTFPGIGVPAVASSGAQCATALLSVWEQLELHEKIRM